jgi:dihydroorotase
LLDASSLVITGGTVVDALGSRRADVRVTDGKVVDVGEGLQPTGDEASLDASGCCVSPGFVDLHVHLREPGDEEAETIETGTRAAARGGFTAVVAMPNTRPALDDAAVVSSVLALGKQAGLCDVVSSGCITVARAGEQLAPMGELYALGVRIFTDDGFCVASAGVMRRALEYAASLPGAIVAQHAEDETLAAGGHMHEGAWSSRLGIPGRPSVAETVIVARDIELCEVTGTPVHFLHCSAAGTVALVRAAKARGLPVTAECAPHHFSLTDECCEGFDPMFKVHPPLRTRADVEAIIEGLADGTIDAIATDHAPHTPESKERPFEEAPPGMLGLETALAVTITELVEPGHLTLADALAALSWRPAALAGLDAHGGPIAPGAPANLTVFDPSHEWVVEPGRLASRARNTPFAGRTLKGKVRHTVLFGDVVVCDGEATR